MKKSFLDLRGTIALTRGWHERQWRGQSVLAAAFGGNEMRVRLGGTNWANVRIATEPYVFCHVLADGRHIARIGPESDPATIRIPVKQQGTELRFLRTAVSSGPFYVDAMLLDVEAEDSACFLPTANPIPDTVFATFGDSISGNCCIGDDAPYDPYGLGYGPIVSARFGWQYFNSARDGSGVSCTPFDNPLAIDRVEQDLIRHEPDVLLVFYGTNDIRSGVPPDQFERDFHALMERISGSLPSTRIATSGLLWNDMATEDQVDAYNKVIKVISDSLGICFWNPGPNLAASDFDDGVHPNARGQQKLAEFFGDQFAAAWPDLVRRRERVIS